MADRFAVVILAAGRSSRLGQPKQLLPYRGRTLIEHAASMALESGATDVIVVVGSGADAIRKKLASLTVRFVENLHWQEGMGGSIRCGVGAVSPHSGCVVIALCDQPRITSGHLHDLATRCLAGAPIVASGYEGMTGAPCAFARSVFPQLLALYGDSGARDLIRGSKGKVAVVEFDGGNLDVDTPEDAAGLTGPG